MSNKPVEQLVEEEIHKIEIFFVLGCPLRKISFSQNLKSEYPFSFCVSHSYISTFIC
tara:strand:- start:328 stop:498 length:171 start_codon:yes stop_codon:yes gene_type:complete